MAGTAPTHLTRRSFVRRIAGWTALAAIPGSYAYARHVEPHWIEVVRRDLSIRQLPPALVGRTLVHLSDLHIGPEVDDDYLVRAFRRVAAFQPDIVAITGDFMTCEHDEEVTHALGLLRQLRPGRLATVAILGNHDYGARCEQVAVADQLATGLADLQISVLRNRTVEVAGLHIAGLDDLWTEHFEGCKPLLRNLDPDRATLVLCHNPDSADLPVWSGYQGWILAGHTHGGQCRVPFGKAPVLPVNNKRYVAGAIDLHDGRRLYINRGLGHVGVPYRFGARPEITVFTLRRGEPSRA